MLNVAKKKKGQDIARKDEFRIKENKSGGESETFRE